MGKEISFCLVYRDMWQSAGKYMPRVDQLIRVAQPIVDMGCFARVETNGGGFEQINLLSGENPNASVRAWTQAFNNAGIQTQMLERGLNALRMTPVPADVRKLMFAVKKKQGTDISRSFDGLNNPQNLELSFQYAREGGMIAQAALCITHSPIHTVDYYVKLADQYLDLGADEIAVKDMAGVGRPASIGKIVEGIRRRHPKVLIQYHGHATTGFAIASSLEAARAGADIIDVGMEPLAWGTGHADLLTIHAMLTDAGFDVPPVNMDAYMEVRTLTQEFVDEWLGFFISPQNRKMNALIIAPGLPGGMMGSLMADLKKNVTSLNKWLEKRGKPGVTEDELLLRLFTEVEHVWPKLGYPPLVTPFSQYVKNVALMNVLQVAKGKERWSMIDENTWGMILGESGQLPGPVDAEIVALAKEQGKEFFEGNPQDLYPDELEVFAQQMQERGWDMGTDDEELLEYAMHTQQYEAFKSGKAKRDFEEELAAQREGEPTTADAGPVRSVEEVRVSQPRRLDVTVNGKRYEVEIDYPGAGAGKAGERGGSGERDESRAEGSAAGTDGGAEAATGSKVVVAPLEGKFYLTKDPGDKGIKVGDKVEKGDTVAYIESMKVINAVTTDQSGTVAEIVARHGEEVDEDDVLIKLS
jgi:pyruvate carboxylase subunit B